MSIELGPRPALPSSPWAKRFPHVRQDAMTYIAEDTNHSFLAPILNQSVDPKYYEQSPNGDTPAPGHSNQGYDRVFLHEEIQRDWLRGIRTWEAASLNTHAYFGGSTGLIEGIHRPGDNNTAEVLQAAYEKDGLRVDESKWLPFLQKDRWYDWFEGGDPALGSPARCWSVDNPEIWDVLKPSIELANRILQTLIDERHEGADDLDDGDDQTLLPQPCRVIISLSKELQMSRWKQPSWDFSFIPNMTSEQWRSRLCNLLSPLVFGLYNLKTTENAYGVSRGADIEMSPQQPPIIALSKEYLEQLLTNKDLLPSERLTYTVKLATIIVHEVSHCINTARIYNDPGYSGNRWTASQVEAEQREPWNDSFNYPRKSDNFFHRWSLLSTSLRPPGEEQIDATVDIWRPIQRAQLSENPNHEQLISITDWWKWNDLQSLFTSFGSGWYDQKRAEWVDSPWYYCQNRIKCAQFAASFSQRNQIDCLNIAKQLASSIRWDKSFGPEAFDLPSLADRASGLGLAWHIIGLLMMASAPIQLDDREQTASKDYRITFEPGREAAASGRTAAFQMRNGLDDIKKVTPSTLFQRDDGASTPSDVHQLSQLHYLDIVDDYFEKYLKKTL
ncbi:hypothetical protein F5Y16DRAFT_425029 [Xylariaceae sp. FL0255]|nr:hypothetical protein F5Y16DRAFT_425029 [Xylariaceae sp. FL0255]